jgi:uncharacterized repeat protein (TIGR02543 family)
MSEQPVPKGRTHTDPGDPADIPAGYTFVGWYALGGTEPFDFKNTPIHSSLKLYAKFERIWDATEQVGDLAALKAAVAAAGNAPLSIELTANITFAAAADLIAIPADKIIQIRSADVPGAPFTINGGGLSRVITTSVNSTLYLGDITITGGLVPSTPQRDAGGGIYNGGTLILNLGAVVSGNWAADSGGGVDNSGTLIMNTGAVVSGNKANNGAGVYNDASGTFSLYGGTISGGTYSNSIDMARAGGVFNVGQFTMSGGDISGNVVPQYGGGVLNDGEFTMSGGKISGNQGGSGGGVYILANAVFNFTGGEISDNRIERHGGGVLNNGGTFSMSQSNPDVPTKITGNKSAAPTKYTSGGGVYNDLGTFTMSGGVISGNVSSTSNVGGGGVYSEGARAVFEMSGGVISGNAADNGGPGGGVSTYLGTFNMLGGVISGNNTTGNGGGVYNSGCVFTMSQADVGIPAEITGNNAANGGGVYNRNRSEFTMSGGTISDNNAANGSGVYNGDYSSFSFTAGTIADNKAENGGGVYNYNYGEFAMSGGTIAANDATDGGGVYNYYYGEFTMSGGTIYGNTSAGSGSGVYNYYYGNFSFTAGTIADNKAESSGGVFNYYYGSFTMSGGTISGNSAAYGGGVSNYYNGEFTMSGGTISGNTSAGNIGGGVSNYYNSKFTMSGGTIYGNSAVGSMGGGVSNRNYSEFTMSGGTISGNSAAYGGGVSNYQNSEFTMSGGTISDNAATYGGGVYNRDNSTFEMLQAVPSIPSIIAVNAATDSGGGIYLYTNKNTHISGGVISGNAAGVSGGGIWTLFADLSRLRVTSGVAFSDNSAASAYSRNPSDDTLYNAQIGDGGAGVTWTAPFDQGYNNFDICYTAGAVLMYVTFMQNHSAMDNTVVERIIVEKDTAIDTQMPPDPVRADHDFTGWNTERDGTGTTYTDSGPEITAVTVLYAQWTPLTPLPPPPPPPERYTVTYSGNGSTSGTVPVDNGRYSSGALVTVLGPGDLAKTDHVFVGWATGPGAADPTYYVGGSFRIYYNTILYAVWQLGSGGLYTVVFVDWDDTVLKTEQVPYGGIAVAPADPSRDGYTFVGWDKPLGYITSDLTVKALYEKESGQWALLNIIMALTGILIIVAAAFRVRRKDGGGEEGDGGASRPAKDIEKHAQPGLAWLYVAAIAAAAGIVFFFITEDLWGPMTLVDKWAAIQAVTLSITAAAAVSAVRRKKELQWDDEGTLRDSED